MEVIIILLFERQTIQPKTTRIAVYFYHEVKKLKTPKLLMQLLPNFI
jgi:hypothetical protein